MFRKLRNNIMLFNILSVSLVLLAAFAVIYWVTARNMDRENSQRLQAMSINFINPAPLPANDTRFSLEFGGSFTLFIQNGQLVNVNSQLDLDEDSYSTAFTQAQGKHQGRLLFADRTWQFQQLTPPPGIRTDSYRIVFLDITHSMRVLQNLLWTLLGVGLAVLLALLFISYRFAQYAVAPIEQNYNKQKQFITDASHELRTPLAVIGANIDAIAASGEETVHSQQEWLGYIRFELNRMGKLVHDLLELARAEQAKSTENIAFHLSLDYETAAASMEAMLYDSGVTLVTEITPNLWLKGDRNQFTRILTILLENAAKYTPPGGQITLQLHPENQRVVLRVSNTGEGIAAKDLPNIFDRFYRGDASRSSQTPGFGLGLSIAKAMVEQLHGSITCGSEHGLTTFHVSFPQ